VQVIAHPDDDLYFMTPDISRFIRNGWGSTTIVVTAAEFNGNGAFTREQYAAQRQDGLRAAYAEMAGVQNVWNRAAVIVGGKQVERDTLVANPRVALVFLNMPEGKDGLPGRSRALEKLWKADFASVLTVVPTGSVVDSVQTYTSEDLTRVLKALFDAASVTVARMLDSHPDHRFAADHTDHTHVALFAERALSAHISSTGAAVTAVSYRGYGVGGLPVNLTPATSAEKQRILSTYAAHDPLAGVTGVGQPRVQRMYDRYLGPSIQSLHQSDGRLGFAAVVSGSVRMWTSSGGTWQHPVVIDGARLAPPLAVARQINGRLRFFALRLDDLHLVTAEQTAPNSDTFTGWLDLGNRDCERPQEIGSPEAAVDGSGRVYVFVKDHAGGVSARSLSAEGTWSSWLTLGGTSVIESLTAAVDTQGRVELYAATGAGILRWTQPLAGAPLTLQPGVSGPVPAGRLTAVPNANGRLQIFYRDPATGGVHTIWQSRDNTPAGPIDLGGQNTFGPVAATVVGGRIMLIAQSTTYELSALRQPAPDAAFQASWRDLAGVVPSQPAVGVDESGRLVIGVVGETGALRTRTGREPWVDGDWTTITA
jgi:LmbE family N-acetylglucosaminyl deacetylase